MLNRYFSQISYILCLVCVFSVGLVFGADKPGNAEIKRAEAYIEQLYGKRIKEAQKTTDKIALVYDLLKTAKEEMHDEPAAQTVLLYRARELAISANDWPAIIAATEAIVTRFQDHKELDADVMIKNGNTCVIEAKSKTGKARTNKLLQAAEWYLLAKSKGTSLQKRIVDKKLGEIADIIFEKKITWYRIINQATNLPLGVPQGLLTPGIKIIQWNSPVECLDTHWMLEKNGRYIKIKNRVSGLYLGIPNNLKDKGCQVCQLVNDEKNQGLLWTIRTLDDAVSITNVNSDMVLDMPTNSNIPIQWPWHGSSNQKWILQEIQ